MPYIEVKASCPIPAPQRETIKAALGKALSILGKGESYLMVGFADPIELYFAGEKQELAAFVAVALLGRAADEACSRMTGEVCRILKETLGIPGDRVYVTYRFVEQWGWNGSNF